MTGDATRRVGRDSPSAGTDAVRVAADLIRIDTTNRGSGDGCERPAAEYVAARLAEAGLEPVLLESAPGRANVVARVSGDGGPGRPGLLLHGHLDAVPADPSSWSVPPFSGEIRDGVLWGRGAVDMKSAVAVLVAVAAQWARGAAGRGATSCSRSPPMRRTPWSSGAQWLVERHPELFEGCTEAIGESGAFTFHAAPGQRLYPIASAERGTAWLKLTARGHAGHGAKPNPANAVTRLGAAVARIGGYAWPVRLIPTVRAAVEAIAAAAGQPVPGAELADEASPGSLAPEELLARLGPGGALVAGAIRNSANPTMLQAGYKVNVIPGEAVGYVDGRVLPGYEQEFADIMDELTGPDVSWEYAHREIPLEAPLGAPVMAAMAQALLAEDPGSVIVPYCMSGGTDAKHFSRLGMTCYGYTPLVLPDGYDYYAMFHGTDERIPLSAIEASVRIMDRFLTEAEPTRPLGNNAYMSGVSVYVALISGGAGVFGATISQLFSFVGAGRQAKSDRRERYENAAQQACVNLLKAAGRLQTQVASNHEYHGAEMTERLAKVRRYAGAAEEHAATVALLVPDRLAEPATKVAAAATRLASAAAARTYLQPDRMNMPELPDFSELDQSVEAFRRIAIASVRRGALSVGKQPARLLKVFRRKRGIGGVDSAPG